jgi:hypothetical protein
MWPVHLTESDSDRAFYDEMNRRLRDSNRVRDVPFIKAQNRQTIRKLVGPLRRIGIAAAAVPNLDLLEDKGTNWKALLDACQVDDSLRPNLEAERACLSAALSTIPKRDGEARPIKTKGINALKPD